MLVCLILLNWAALIMHWEHRSMVGYNGWQLSYRDGVKNTRHHLLPTVGGRNRSAQTEWNMLSFKLIHKSLRMESADRAVCALVILWCANRWMFLSTISWRTIFNPQPCCEPGAMTNTLPGSLWFWASLLFMGLIACSSSSLGDEMYFNFWAKNTDVVLGSSVWLKKGQKTRKKGRRKEQ